MGSVGVIRAKQQFFQFVDTISTSDLPTFTIWLDAKLAEYKTLGQLKPDAEEEAKEEYPEWIARSLRHNLSFMFPSLSSHASDRNIKTSAKIKARKRGCSQSSDAGKGSKMSKGAPLVCTDHAEENVVVTSDDTRTVAVKTELGSAPEDDEEALASDDGGAEDDNDASEGGLFTTAKESAKTSTLTWQKAKSLSSRSAAKDDNRDSDYDPTSGGVSSDKESACDSSPASKLKDASCSPLFEPLPTSTPASEHSGTVRLFRKLNFEYSADEVEEAIMKYHAGKQSTYAVTVEDIEGLRDDHRMFNCPLCGKQCGNIHTYRRHFVSHTGERPFKCSYCPRTFSESSRVYSHCKKDHKDMPHVKAEPVV